MRYNRYGAFYIQKVDDTRIKSLNEYVSGADIKASSIRTPPANAL